MVDVSEKLPLHHFEVILGAACLLIVALKFLQELDLFLFVSVNNVQEDIDLSFAVTVGLSLNFSIIGLHCS